MWRISSVVSTGDFNAFAMAMKPPRAEASLATSTQKTPQKLLVVSKFALPDQDKPQNYSLFSQ
jgi:hypothetical protein